MNQKRDCGIEITAKSCGTSPGTCRLFRLYFTNGAIIMTFKRRAADCTATGITFPNRLIYLALSWTNKRYREELRGRDESNKMAVHSGPQFVTLFASRSISRRCGSRNQIKAVVLLFFLFYCRVWSSGLKRCHEKENNFSFRNSMGVCLWREIITFYFNIFKLPIRRLFRF